MENQEFETHPQRSLSVGFRRNAKGEQKFFYGRRCMNGAGLNCVDAVSNRRFQVKLTPMHICEPLLGSTQL
ncbi:hypothetical protein [Nostoc sp.]|uniref:hypothetical protein n=1 Tax=Nostoc sp. TaxID=1180 RepID=UPI002FFD2527